MKLRANCKINIGLDVLRRRADGFHDVSTVMVPVRELYDRLEIEPAIETELVQLGLLRSIVRRRTISACGPGG